MKCLEKIDPDVCSHDRNDRAQIPDRRYIRKECAWCGMSLDIARPPGNSDLVTHGICDKCCERLLAEGLITLDSKN